MKKLTAPCPKHERQESLQITASTLKSGDMFFQVKCPVCGKQGPRRRTMHGCIMAWEELYSIKAMESSSDALIAELNKGEAK